MAIDGIVLTVLAVLVGLVVGFLRRGRLARVGHVTVRAKTLLALGVVIPALADRFTRDVAVPLVVFALGALFVFALCNVRMVGMSVMAIGILANLLATALNGGMPVRQDALVSAGLATRDEVDRVELDGARRLEEPTHRVRILGDIIPLEETGQVLSFGDLVILVGLADIAANLTLRRRRRGEARDDETPPADALDEIERLLHASVHARTGAAAGRDPRPAPRLAPHPGARVDAEGDAEPDTAVAAASAAPDVAWYAAHPSRDAFWQDADHEAVIDLVPAPATDATDEPAAIDEPAVMEAPAAIDEPAAADEPAAIDEPAVIDGPAAIDEPAERAVVDLAGPDAVLELPDAVLDHPGEALAPALVETPPAAPLADVADVADVDDVLAGLFRDLGRKRSRRRGGRDIPDFEPVHLDDAVTPSGR